MPLFETALQQSPASRICRRTARPFGILQLTDSFQTIGISVTVELLTLTSDMKVQILKIVFVARSVIQPSQEQLW
jgi:hypothetical protein